MREKMSVLVTGVGGRSVGHQILQALAMAGERYRVVAVDAAPFSFGLYQTEARYVVPSAASPEYLPAVQGIVEREGISVILPGTQAELNLLAHRAHAFGHHCRVLANPFWVIDRCANKARLYQWLSTVGVAVPHSVEAGQWRSLVESYGFPIIAKPTEETGGSKGVAILADEREVTAYLRTAQADQVVMQEYVGSMEGEYTVGVMISHEGQIIDSIVLHRELVGLTLGTKREIDGKTYGLSTGYSQGFIVRHEKIQAECEALALRLGARGPLNIQLRWVDGRAVIFEVHPRFSGTTSIRAQAGFNEPDTLIRNAVFGEQFGRLPYQTDVAAIRAFSHVLVPRATMNSIPTTAHGAAWEPLETADT